MIDALVVVIRKMDEQFRKWHEDLAKKQAKAQKPIGGSKRPK